MTFHWVRDGCHVEIFNGWRLKMFKFCDLFCFAWEIWSWKYFFWIKFVTCIFVEFCKMGRSWSCTWRNFLENWAFEAEIFFLILSTTEHLERSMTIFTTSDIGIFADFGMRVVHKLVEVIDQELRLLNANPKFIPLSRWIFFQFSSRRSLNVRIFWEMAFLHWVKKCTYLFDDSRVKVFFLDVR